MKTTKISSNCPKTLKISLSFLVLVSATVLLSAQTNFRTPSREKLITNLVRMVMERLHYSAKSKKLDDAMSKTIYNEYFERLDAAKGFFRQSDLDEFKDYELKLDDNLKTSKLEFAFKVHKRFEKRVAERVKYINKTIENKFDFTKNEELKASRKEAKWFDNDNDCNAYWRKRVKNSLLTYQMMDEAAEKDDENDSWVKSTPQQRVKKFYQRFSDQIKDRTQLEIAEIFLSTYTRIFDPHSVYMAPDTEEDFDISMRLSLSGIGAVLTIDGPYIKVNSVVVGGPAGKDGRLEEGDRLIAIAQKKNEEPTDLIDMPLNKAVKLIRGKKGTVAYVTVLKGSKGVGSVPEVIDIVRDDVKLTESEAKSEIKKVKVLKNDANILLITLPSFYADFEAMRKGKKDYKSTTRDIRKLISDADESDIKGMILDLRMNGGGSLDEAISLAGLFFADGPVVQVRSADGKVRKRLDLDKSVVFDKPLIVLVDHFSASASEIVAACLQDYHRAVIIGEKTTHGKGSVQTIYDLNRLIRRSSLAKVSKLGAVKFTMAKFYRVNGGSTQVKGVTPDITIPSFTDHMDLGENKLPHVMPWDEIAALDYSCNTDVRPELSYLRKCSADRLAKDNYFQDYVKNINSYAEFAKKKVISLNKKRRQELQKEEELWAKKIKERSSKTVKKKKKKGEEVARDIVLEEAMQVMGDMLRKARAKDVVNR